MSLPQGDLCPRLTCILLFFLKTEWTFPLCLMDELLYHTQSVRNVTCILYSKAYTIVQDFHLPGMRIYLAWTIGEGLYSLDLYC